MQTRTTLYFQRIARPLRIGKERGLYRVSAKIRTAERRRIRVRPNASRPGAAPHAHTRGGIRVIKFAVTGDTAIIGPVKFPRSNFFNQPVPHIHEFGKSVRSRFGRRRFYKYPQRPFAEPTLRRLVNQGQINKDFSVSVARVF